MLERFSDLLKLDQLPAKTFQQIARELGQPELKTEKIDLEKEVAAFKTMAAGQVLARIDQLVLQRRG